MDILTGWGGRVRGLFTDTKGPWGPSGSDGGSEPPNDADKQGNGPWGEPPRRGRRVSLGGTNVSALDELLRRSRARFGGGGGGLPGRPDRSLLLWPVAGVVLLLLVLRRFRCLSP